MERQNSDYEVLLVQQDRNTVQTDAVERADIDAQVATAKRYPRDIARSINNSIAMATTDYNTAQSCGYALPRGGKPVAGPSVNLAKLIVSNWGNIRVEAKVAQVTDRQVISRGTCWDMENNVSLTFEVRRSIVGKGGKRFSDDMITATGNAANAIAYRNAVFFVIPKAVTDRVYQAAQRVITGDLSDDRKLAARRKKCIDSFKNECGVTEQEVVMLCGKQTVSQIKADQIALLLGIMQSLKNGDTTVEELMKPYRKEEAKKTIAEKAALAATKSEE